MSSTDLRERENIVFTPYFSYTMRDVFEVIHKSQNLWKIDLVWNYFQ